MMKDDDRRWDALGELKSGRLGYIRVAQLLAEARDKGLHKTLGYPDLESFAEERLQVARETVGRYLEVYDWIAGNRREWLEPDPKVPIPDMADVADVIWIERELSRTDLKARTRARLERLREKALKHRLGERDVAALDRLRSSEEEELMRAATELQNLRMEMSGSKLASDLALPQLDARLDGAALEAFHHPAIFRQAVVQAPATRFHLDG